MAPIIMTAIVIITPTIVLLPTLTAAWAVTVVVPSAFPTILTVSMLVAVG
jgi:hypothetical protein